MALSEKELEKQLNEAGNKILSPPSSITELISNLDRVESLLTRVEQSPSESMRKALSPSMKALIANELLRHSNIDVKVSVAACISEITRITAPDAPYDDEQMKDVFQLIVSSFDNLDDTSSQSYNKRTSILETVAKVRSCVVMLDLECDALIAEMFQHFFRCIRSQHPENVVSSMETIMTLVLEESEDVSVDLVSSILKVLKKDNKDVLPVARQLGEKVFEKCVSKIEPCLLQAMKSLHSTRDDYPNIVADVLNSKSEATETKDADAASKNVADENDAADKSTEKAVEVATLDDAPPSEEVGPTAVVSPKSPVSNGTMQKEAEDTSVGNDNDKEAVKEADSEPHGEEEETGKTEVEDVVAEELPKPRTKSVKINKRKGKKSKSSRSSSEPSEPVTDEKEVVEKSELDEKDNEKDNNAQNEDPVADSAEPAENEKEPEETVPSPKKSDEPVDVPSLSPSGSLADENAAEKVEPEEKKDEQEEQVPAGDVEMKEADINESEEAVVSEPKSDKKGPSTTDEEVDAPSSADVSKKENEKTSESDAKSAKQSGKKVQVVSQSEDRKKRGQGKVATTKDSAKSSSKDEGKKSAAKPVKSAAKPAKDESGADEGSKANTKRKHSSENKGDKFGKELVGSKIQVWWPDDKKFYAGTIEHFDPSTGKHKVLYNDGDVEVLKLEKEKWKLTDGSLSHDPGHSSDRGDDPDEVDEMPKSKKAKTSPAVGAKQKKTEASAKKGGSSSSKSKATSKSKQTEDNRSGGKSKDETLKSMSKLAENKSGKSKDSKTGNSTPKSGGKSKDNEVEPSKGSSKSKQETPKGGAKSKTKSPKVGSKSSNSKAKAAPPPEEDEDEEMESSPETVKAPGNSKGKSGSKSSQKSPKKRKRSTKG